jgi:hypothetical protein
VRRVYLPEQLELEKDVQSELSHKLDAVGDTSNGVCLLEQASHTRSLSSPTNSWCSGTSSKLWTTQERTIVVIRRLPWSAVQHIRVSLKAHVVSWKRRTNLSCY